MPAIEETHDWHGLDLYDADSDDKIGEITEIYLDRATGEAEWLAVKTGLLGTKVNFVPIASAVREGDRVRVPYSKDLVKDAPNVEEGELSDEEERRLYEHYDVAWGEFDPELQEPIGQPRLQKYEPDPVGR